METEYEYVEIQCLYELLYCLIGPNPIFLLCHESWICCTYCYLSKVLSSFRVGYLPKIYMAYTGNMCCCKYLITSCKRIHFKIKTSCMSHIVLVCEIWCPSSRVSAQRCLCVPIQHYRDFIMGTIASHIISLTIVYSTVYAGADQRKHQSSASLAFVRGIHRGSVNSP